MTLLQHSIFSSHCSQGASGAATAQPLHEIKETEAGRVMNKTRDKWRRAGSSLEFNPWLPETQLSSLAASVPSLLHPGSDACTRRSHPWLSSSRSGVGLPSWHYQADLRAGEGSLLKATFDFSFLSHLLQQTPRSICDLPRQGRREKEQSRSSRILLQMRFSQHNSQTPVWQPCSIPGSKAASAGPGSGGSWHIDHDESIPTLPLPGGAEGSPPAKTGGDFPPICCAMTHQRQL